MKFVKNREVMGSILSADVRRNPIGKYFLPILVENKIEESLKTVSFGWVDIGIRSIVIL
ncbi:hypothetical protein [Bacillus cereus]|uniref:hypothetical protein n=1 Tax=Bacillus cereus TaxID=1396 RepID=UPI0012FB1202|nr:hypothetical protein [Bacillus cereus]